MNADHPEIAGDEFPTPPVDLVTGANASHNIRITLADT
jgi:hypothetical protein